jgi:hypothetical protein
MGDPRTDNEPVIDLVTPAGHGADRVREHTAARVLDRLDEAAADRVRDLLDASPPELDRRITELEHETDMERVLTANASVLALAGVTAGAFVHRRWLIVPAIVTGFLLQHAVQGWCPPVALFRRLGVRTRQEIDAELHTLKAVRGDYSGVERFSAEGFAPPFDSPVRGDLR